MKKRRRINQCPNCKEQLGITDNFCPKCGQENHVHTFTARELWDDFISSVFNFDGKIFTTFKTIFLRPGKVPKDIIAGKKIRYVPTLRFYFFVSFIYFLILNFGVDLTMQSNEVRKILTKLGEMRDEQKIPVDFSTYKLYKDSSEVALHKLALNITDTLQGKYVKRKTLIEWEKKNAIDTIFLRNDKKAHTEGGSIKISMIGTSYNYDDKVTFSPTQIVYKINNDYDSITVVGYKISKSDLKALHEDRDSITSFVQKLDKNLGYFDRAFTQTQVEATAVFRNGTLTETKNYVRRFLKKNLSNFSLALLLIMPLSALILYIFYFYKQPKLVPHIIFTIHLHTVMLVLFSILFAMIAGQYVFDLILNQTAWDIIVMVLLTYSSVYFIFAIRRFYDTSWLNAIVKSCIISSIYSILLFSIIIGVFMISMIL